jgi:hypothetical protein
VVGDGLRETGPSYITTGIAIVVASLIAVPPIAQPQPAVQVRAVHLTSTDTADSPLGDGTALVMGPSTIPIPTQRYLDLADQLYLQQLGYTGTPQALATPEGLYPITGVKSLPLDTSVAQGQQILENAVQQQPGTATDPTVVFGWSQSSTISSLTMDQLKAAGVPTDDVHFVLVGDPSNPNGGLLERFDVPINGQSPTVPALGVTFSGATPDDLYPTDIYTAEYDGFADYPTYPIDFLSDLNAILGILIQHTSYLSLSPDQIEPQSASNPDGAILLPGSEDSVTDPCTDGCLTNYWMIPDQELPLLQPLQFVPFIGQPLYDLLEPDMRILVNLGYGSITDGWDPGPANVPTTFGLFPTDIDPTQLTTALGNGLQQGVTGAFQQLLNPDNYNLSSFLTSIENNPFLAGLVTLTHALGLTDATSVSDLFDLPTLLGLARNALGQLTGFPTSDASLFSSSPTDIINSITGTLSGDYATLLPIADSFNTLLTTVPSVLASFVTEQLADGNVLAAIGDPIAAFVGLVPFLVTFADIAPVAIAAGGTLVNLADLFGLGDIAG